MAFRPAALDVEQGVQVDGLTNETEHIARIFIGDDPATGAIYSLVVILTSQPHLPPGTMELIFGITEVLPEGGENWINDGLTTKSFLQGGHRKKVLTCICSAAQILAQGANPDSITFMTVNTDLPPKALTKYGVICKALKHAGYRGGEGDSFHGSRIWMLKRRSS